MQNEPPSSLQFSRSGKYGCLILNLLVIPGIGSLMAGRKGEGAAQMVMSVVGMVLTVLWLGYVIFTLLKTRSLYIPVDGFFKVGLVGLGIFVTGWLWSFKTGMDVSREFDEANSNQQ
jgi:hypothetical protein